MWTCALLSSAISAAFSPPHRPRMPFGGRSGLDGSHGPSTAAAAVKAKAALVSIGTSLPIYPPQSTFGHYAHPKSTGGPHMPRPGLDPCPTAPPDRLRCLRHEEYDRLARPGPRHRGRERRLGLTSQGLRRP